MMQRQDAFEKSEEKKKENSHKVWCDEIKVR